MQLQKERHNAVLRILQLILSDINHHLQLIQTRNTIGETELENMQSFLKEILSQSKEAKQKYVLLEQNIRVNLEEYQKKTTIFKDELRIITDQNRKLMGQKELQDRQLAELQRNLQIMLESEQKISGEWLDGVSLMEKKVLGMRETMSMTLDQLKESVKVLAEYKAKMQTLKVRIKIEEKVRQTYEAGQYEKRHKMLEEQLITAEKRQESLQIEIKTIQSSWADYYAMAIEDIKQRFAEVDKATFNEFMVKQKQENEEIERELSAIMGEVQSLETEIVKSKDGQNTDHLHKLKQ